MTTSARRRFSCSVARRSLPFFRVASVALLATRRFIASTAVRRSQRRQAVVEYSTRRSVGRTDQGTRRNAAASTRGVTSVKSPEGPVCSVTRSRVEGSSFAGQSPPGQSTEDRKPKWPVQQHRPTARETDRQRERERERWIEDWRGKRSEMTNVRVVSRPVPH